MSRITTHVLDTVLGKPADGISVRLDIWQGDNWTNIGAGVTDVDGRCRGLAENIPVGVYRLTFVVDAYLQRLDRSSIYPEIAVTFHCNGEPHFHLPLLLGGNSYTTYRGS
jgi:5-hydroxyisourate hydrolase